MVINIIKPGKTPADEPKMRATCNSCKCEFSFQAVDAALVSDQREGDYYQLNCPNNTCGAIVTHFKRGN